MIEVPYFKAFIEPYFWSGVHHLIRHKRVQQFWFYMYDDGILAMHSKLL